MSSVVDRATGSVFVWSPVQHSLTRIRARDGRVDVGAVSETMLPSDGQTSDGGYSGQTTWPASLTVYDAATGEIQVLYGVVGRDTWLSFPAQR